MHTTKIIDVHTHVYPESIRGKALQAVGEYYGREMFAKGSPNDLLDQGSKINIVKYIVHPVATKADQVETNNQFITDLQQKNDCFIGFGTVHPETPNVEETIEGIMQAGLKGIKLHPEFQRFNIDDPHMFKIYQEIAGRLPLLIHMGDENATSSSPKRLAKILSMFPSLTVIAPHLGGYTMWDEVMEFLVGKNVYFDTSSAIRFMDKRQAVDIIRSHGTDKVMFGTDYPMWLHEEELELFYSLGLTEVENREILCENAIKLFDIDI